MVLCPLPGVPHFIASQSPESKECISNCITSLPSRWGQHLLSQRVEAGPAWLVQSSLQQALLPSSGKHLFPLPPTPHHRHLTLGNSREILELAQLCINCNCTIPAKAVEARVGEPCIDRQSEDWDIGGEYSHGKKSSPFQQMLPGSAKMPRHRTGTVSVFLSYFIPEVNAWTISVSWFYLFSG